jgi:hypothetical protein
MLLDFSKIRTQKVEDLVGKQFCQKNHCVKHFKAIGIEKTGNGDKIYRNIVFTFCTHNAIQYSNSFTIYTALNGIGITFVIF